MTTKISSSFHLLGVAVGALALFATSQAQADLDLHITLDTSTLLSSSVAAPFYLDFQLNDGSGWGDANNTATLTHFSFTGGSATGTGTSSGGAAGSLASTVWLKDSSAFNEYFQAFTPGSSLSFDLDLTTNVDQGGVPDLFSFAVLDNTLSNLPTLAPGTDSLFTVNIDSATPSFTAYAGDITIAPAAGGDPIGLASPSATPIPEASTYGMVGAAALVGLIALRRRTKAVLA